MQTFRDCERQVDLAFKTDDIQSFSCNGPLIFADLVCGPIASTDTPMIQGASRAMMYGGGHLKFRYDVAVVNDTEMPCSFDFKIVTALVVLPLLEDDLTPAYLPNLAIARSQLSVVHATESDTDENILYWDDSQVFAYNISCSGSDINGEPIQCITDACPGGSSERQSLVEVVPFGFIAALYGRHEVRTRIKSRRRLKEREALFLLTEIVSELPNSSNYRIPWPIRRTVYHRYAVRPSR